MLEQSWGPFVIYVNAYYAVQEAYDAARRHWERPPEGLQQFCRDANPFLWDTESSADEALYEDFSARFAKRFPDGLCEADEGFDFAKGWLASQEGERFGTALVSSLEQTVSDGSWAHACELVARQLGSRAAHIERTPQDAPDDDWASEPSPTRPPLPAQTIKSAATQPTKAEIEAVISLLARGDEDFAASLRARLHDPAQEA